MVFDKNKIIIIKQSDEWLYKYIQELGFQCKDSYKNHGLVFRLIREIFFRLKLPGKEYFYNWDVIDSNKIFVIGEGRITYEYIKWLHKKCPTCKMVMIYTNPVKPNYSPNGFLDRECVKWSSDKNDAIKYGMRLYEGGAYFPQWKVVKKEPEYDVFYVGKDKNRLEKIRQIENEMNEYGIKTKFYITWERSWQKKRDGIHSPFMPYEEVLKYVGKSKAILHLIEGAQKGLTLRIQESLIHKVKLITDDLDIVNYDFYNSNNIFILGKDNMENLRAFVDSPYVEVKSDFFKHVFYEDMVREIVADSFMD